ncbi:hypothetical protein [Parafrankia sp. EUN1f]|uniref:hypothetical protein n=1 Tax=Parafrankia sp. EUN1f TaxID=102897 RepID=UPI0001C4510F|nr:hypothetical protein [Parafrankia sp. EUN1f]EFC85203.1 hypothetical protein FrEUN1fDRAFT_1656 [Parafrankia sp. EUN1f]
MSLINSLLEGLDASDRERTVGLINRSIAADLASVADGAGPARQVDVGTRSRARRTRSTSGSGARSGR